jgi:hypothetical protein
MMYLSTRRVGAVINAANAHYKMTFKGLKEGLKESGESEDCAH